jgi:hypothetical protein
MRLRLKTFWRNNICWRQIQDQPVGAKNFARFSLAEFLFPIGRPILLANLSIAIGPYRYIYKMNLQIV